MKNKPIIFFVVNVDWFFLSHRLPLALAMKERGYQVFILTKDTGRRSDIEAFNLTFIDVDFERSGNNPLRELRVIKRLVRIFRDFKPDIIHNVTIKPALYSSIALKFYRGNSTKFINAISGLGYNFINDRDGFVQRIVRLLMRFAYRGPIYFIFQNRDDMNLYKKSGFLSNHNYRIIKGSGVDSDDFGYSLPSLSNKVTVVFIARMLIDKGVREFIKAGKILQDEWGDRIRFLLVGDVDKDNLASLTREELEQITVPGYIDWVGYIDDVKSILINADIACLPSYREGLPKSLIEAMAIGRPVITTDVPGCRDCVENGVNGFLVPPRDPNALAQAVETLARDKTLRLEMGKASRKKMVSEMSLEKVISETLDFYDQI